MSRRDPGDVERWRQAVFRDPHLSDATKLLLILLADEMSADLRVSVPRAVLAARLDRSERRVSDRLREALGEPLRITDAERECRTAHRLLDRVARGQKHVQAVYQGLLPDVALSGTHVCPAETSRETPPSDSQEDAQKHPENVQKCPPENAESGSQRDTRGSHLYRADLSASGHDRNVGSEEKAEGRLVRFPLTGCVWHEHLCPDDCAKHPATREASA